MIESDFISSLWVSYLCAQFVILLGCVCVCVWPLHICLSKQRPVSMRLACLFTAPSAFHVEVQVTKHCQNRFWALGGVS